MNKEEACRLATEAVEAVAAALAAAPALDAEHDALDVPALRHLHDLQLPDKVLSAGWGASCYEHWVQKMSIWDL